MNFMTQVVEFSTDQATTPDKVRDSSPTNVFIVIIVIISNNIHKSTYRCSTSSVDEGVHNSSNIIMYHRGN